MRCWSKSDSAIFETPFVVKLFVLDTGGFLQEGLSGFACSELRELAGYHKINSLRVVDVSMID